MRYLVLYQNEDGYQATLIQASDAADALAIADDFSTVRSVNYALLIHDGAPVPDVYDTEGEPVVLSDAPPEVDVEPEEDEGEPDPEPPNPLRSWWQGLVVWTSRRRHVARTPPPPCVPKGWHQLAPTRTKDV